MLANTGSFSRAAEERKVTQSAFSRRIRQLEAWLGTTLISRATLPAELTADGRAFLPVAHDTIRTFHALRESMNPRSESHRPRLTFAALHTLTVTFLPGWLEQMRQAVPGLITAIIPDRGGIEANLEALTSGEVDLFLTYAHPYVPLLLDAVQFEWKVLGHERLVPVVAPALARALVGPDCTEGVIERAIRSGQALPYLDYGKSSFFGVVLQRLFAQAPAFRRQVVHQNTISAGLRECALAGWGLCWLPENLIQADLASGRLVPASHAPDWSLPAEIRLYRRRETAQAVMARFWKSLPEI